MYRDTDNLYHTDHIIRLLSGTGGDYKDTRGSAYRLRTVSVQSSPCLGNNASWVHCFPSQGSKLCSACQKTGREIPAISDLTALRLQIKTCTFWLFKSRDETKTPY